MAIALYGDKDAAAIASLKRQGIEFKDMDVKNGELVEVKDRAKRVRREDPLQAEIARTVARRNKKQKVKPNYKKKQKAEVEKLRRKAKRNLIKSDIQRQKKERAAAASRKKKERNG